MRICLGFSTPLAHESTPAVRNRRCDRASATALAAAFALTGPLPVAADECADIKAVIAANHDGFSGIRAATRPGERWDVTQRVSGYADCYLQRNSKNGLTYYSCEGSFTPSPFDSKPMKDRLNSNANPIADCLNASFTNMSVIRGPTNTTLLLGNFFVSIIVNPDLLFKEGNSQMGSKIVLTIGPPNDR
jgi:hypothetical protein